MLHAERAMPNIENGTVRCIVWLEYEILQVTKAIDVDMELQESKRTINISWLR